MMEWKLAGAMMIFPTILVSLYITRSTWKINERWINLAITCWIVANASWMWMEFYGNPNDKWIAGFPFLFGIIFCAVFFFRQRKA